MSQKKVGKNDVKKVKKEIRSILDMDVELDDIRLFGSRVMGAWNKDSDLDVAIKSYSKTKDCNIIVFGMNAEVRFVRDTNLSWLKHSV